MDRGQITFLSFAALLLLFQTLKGWRLGLVQQIVRFGALGAAYAVAYLGGGAATIPFLRPLGYPDIVLQYLGGAALGLFTYVFICLLGGILFKRTAHQDLGLVWFFYGSTGAALGLAFGLILILFAADTIRLLGGMAEAQSLSAASNATKATGPAKKVSLVNAGLVELKHSLESGVPGEILQTLDPVPKKAYVISGKIGRTAANAESVGRFLTYPGAKELVTMPEIEALREDPEILRALRDHQYLVLLKNEKFLKAANDPKIAAKLKHFELEKALDYAAGK